MEPTQPVLTNTATGAAKSKSHAQDEITVRLSGIGVSSGIATGPALIFSPDREVDAEREQGQERPVIADAEIERLQIAITAAVLELRELAEKVAREIGPSEAGIFEAQASILEDPTIMERATELINQESATAEIALRTTAEEQAGLLAALPDPVWKARASDVRDAIQRPLDHLRPESLRRPSLADQLAKIGQPVIIVANDLMPSDTVQLGAAHVKAIALAGGNATAHAAILARSLGIPAVMGAGSQLLEIAHDNDLLVVDGQSGQVIVRPSKNELDQAQILANQQRDDRRRADARMSAWRVHPGRTQDGKSVPLLANVGTTAEAQAAANLGAEGIGLLRTEFLFSSQPQFPGEEEQASLYEAIIATFAGSERLGHRPPIIIRTLDVGSDKPLPSLEAYVRNLPEEANPALGVRGIRLQLVAKELLVTQLRAILRATRNLRANVRIMLPMVSTLEEIQEARRLLVKVRSELSIASTIPLGIMVETPAAVLSAPSMAREATFFSIGTNDLTQYVMAADRLSPALSQLCQPTQPAVLQAIAAVVAGAHHAGRHVGVCGEMAANPKFAQLLVGLGIDDLSMTPASIPAVKETLAEHSLAELQALAADILRATSVAEVEKKLASSLS